MLYGRLTLAQAFHYLHPPHGKWEITFGAQQKPLESYSHFTDEANFNTFVQLQKFLIFAAINR
jgi:hypothetical protein